MKKRLISLLLAFSMMLTFLPAGAVSAFAEGTADDTTKGTLLSDGQPITTGGTYRLSGPYTKAIKINTSESVTINIAAGDEVTFQPEEHAGPYVLLDVVTNSDLTVNNNGVYNGPTFLYISTNSANAKVTINGGRYNITKQPNVETCAFDFEVGGSDENPIVVDGVYIETGLDCTGIEACGAPKVMIKNSTINVLDTGYTGGGAINIVDSRVDRDPLVILENVTAHAPKSATIRINGGNLIINSGHYTSDRSSVVSIYGDYNYTTAVPTVEIHGGEFIGSGSQSPTLAVYKTNGTMKIHGGTFTSTKCGQVLGNKAHVTIDGTPEFNSEGGTADAIVNVDGGQMEFNGGTITVSGGSGRAALRADGTTNKNKTEINGGKIIGAKYGIQVRNGKPNVILGDVQFENNNTDIYLNKNQKITIEKTFNHNATVDCADPKDGRQLTQATAPEGQEKLKLTSANADYLVGYKTEDGQEYRCFSKKVGVTINGLDGEIKAEDPAEFTVTLTHENSPGTGILTFGDKNSEIEYKDKNGAYQPMPKDGLEVDLSGDKNDYVFHITPKNAGEQKLTAAVVRDAVELGTADKNFTVADRVHTTVTIEGLENAVIKEGESKDFTIKVDPKDDAKLGEAFIDFGNKNSEIEYKDEESGEYKPMPEGGLKIGLGNGEVERKFRITPKNAGEQTLTAAVVRDAVEVGKDSKDYTVAGRVHTTVAIEGLENAVIKEGESKDFTVKVTPNDDAKLGEAFIDFGDKNSEIEYQDKNDEYKPMPEGGLPIDLGDVKEQYAFRIAPKETGKQTLTAAVKKGENELATDEKDFVVSEMPILTLKDGVITSVTVPGKNGADPEDITEIVKKNANEDGSFHVPEGATVSVAFDKDAFADSGLKFGHWDITGLDDPNAYQDKESFAFVMPAKAVTLKAMTQDASIEDDEPDIVGPIVIGTTVVVGGAVLGYQAYSLGAEFAGKLMALPYFPSNRSALAMMLWEDAGKPMPESELLYPDVGHEERDMDLQHAARWAMENELIPDLNDEGTAPEEMKFYPDNTVSKIDVLKAWQKAQELKQNA